MAPTTRSSSIKKAKPSSRSPTYPSDIPFKPSNADKTEILNTLYTLVSKTSPNSTICPSQIPRSLHASDPKVYKDWRSMMEPVRNIVWEEVKKGFVQVTQGGVVRVWEEREGLKGPIRVRRGEKWDDR
jgi:hypothetical protein